MNIFPTYTNYPDDSIICVVGEGIYLLTVSWDMIVFPIIWNEFAAFLKDVFTRDFILLSLISLGKCLP